MKKETSVSTPETIITHTSEEGIKEIVNTPVTKPEYDGFEDLVEPQIDGTYKTTRTKLYLSDSEVKKFMGDNDPAKYFRLGKVPKFMPKSIGSMLPEDRIEMVAKNDIYSKFPDVLMFKHDLTNIYTLLIPKAVTEHELNKDGEFESRLVQYDTRSIPFNGGPNRPSSFEVDFFKKESAKILKHLTAKAEERKVY